MSNVLYTCSCCSRKKQKRRKKSFSSCNTSLNWIQYCEHTSCVALSHQISLDKTFPRSIFGSIRPLSACLWYPNVPGGDGHGTVHISRVHHLLEILLPLVWRSVCYSAICNADRNTDAHQPVFPHFAWMKTKCLLISKRNSAAAHEVQPCLYHIKTRTRMEKL